MNLLGPPERTQAGGTARRLRILAAIERSEAAGLVTKCLLELHAGGQAIEVLLLNVQPIPVEWLTGGQMRDRLIDLGRRAVSSVARHLDAADIPHRTRVELADPTETIVRYADEENSDLIVLAEAKPSVVRSWLMRSTGMSIGSAASVVIHFARVPVIVAK